MGLIFCHSQGGPWTFQRAEWNRAREKRTATARSELAGEWNFLLVFIHYCFFYHSFTFRLQFYDDTLPVPSVRAVIAHSRLLCLFSYLFVISYSNPFKPFHLSTRSCGLLTSGSSRRFSTFPQYMNKTSTTITVRARKTNSVSLFMHTSTPDSAITSKATAIPPPGSEVKMHHGPSLVNT